LSRFGGYISLNKFSRRDVGYGTGLGKTLIGGSLRSPLNPELLTTKRIVALEDDIVSDFHLIMDVMLI
jgi:hypothetical protein